MVHDHVKVVSDFISTPIEPKRTRSLLRHGKRMNTTSEDEIMDLGGCGSESVRERKFGKER
ncbi:hypothetical protein TanjilG_28917 [Lupinus angustifolius]|uniref:Uncharacterized protein n=1 Tax=Lupinus angustifolius TaxID=3871 RepID=A0A4P1QXH2_LUPAN|nr:hypothetical protein TanjilG_28917 [Lupinus angustifolius]